MTELQKLAITVRKLTIALSGFSGELKTFNENIEKNTKVLQELKEFFEGNAQEYGVTFEPDPELEKDVEKGIQKEEDKRSVDNLIDSVPPPEEEEKYGE